MWHSKRLAWIGSSCFVLLLIVLAILFHYGSTLNVLTPLFVQARCGVASGGKISGKRAQVTCGLTRAEIEAVIASAVNAFDLQGLIDQAQKNQIKDFKTIEALAEQLGLTPEAALNILKTLKSAEPSPVPPAERLAVLIAPYTHVVADLRSQPPHGRSHAIKDPPQASKEEIQEDVKRVLAECAIAAGAGIELESIDIKCGPNAEEIGVIIERMAVETNLAGLLKDIRQGISSDGSPLKKLADELHLTQNSLLRLLTLLARSDTPPYQVSTELTAVVKKHIALAQRIDHMRQDDPMLQHLSEQSYAATGAGDFTHAEALLHDYDVVKSFKENEDKALVDREAQHQQTLANLKKEDAARHNLLKAEHAKALSELNEETKREMFRGQFWQVCFLKEVAKQPDEGTNGKTTNTSNLS